MFINVISSQSRHWSEFWGKVCDKARLICAGEFVTVETRHAKDSLVEALETNFRNEHKGIVITGAATDGPWVIGVMRK